MSNRGELGFLHNSTSKDNSKDQPSDSEILGNGSPGEGGWYSQYTPEPIEVIEAWGLNHHLASALSYIVRADKKNGIEDIDKAIWFLNRYKKFKYSK